jgi:hypothetical protein
VSKDLDRREDTTRVKTSIILPIFKKKDKLVCDNYRGISHVSHVEKLVATIILKRIGPRTEPQAGFTPGRSTVDQLFSLRLQTGKYQEFDKDLHLCYVDFQKAFDSVWRKGLRQIMRHLGYDREVIRILENLYSETKSAVRTGSKEAVSSWFETWWESCRVAGKSEGVGSPILGM